MSGNLAFLDFNAVHARRSLESIEALKARVDIAEIVSRYVALRRDLGLCPFHNEKTPSFRVNRQRQRWKCFGCGAGGDVLDFLSAIEGLDGIAAIKRLRELLGDPVATIKPVVRPQADEPDPDAEAKRERALEMWRTSEVIWPGLEAPWRYLRERRGITRWNHDRLRWHAQSGCILAPVNAPGGGLVQAVWRIWPRLEGEVKRRGLGPMGGGMSCLFPAEGSRVVIAEGAEDALAARELTGLPAWAALSAGNMKALVLPARLREVLILADADDTGCRSAHALAARLRSEGREAVVRVPTQGKDANDVLCARRAF